MRGSFFQKLGITLLLLLPAAASAVVLDPVHDPGNGYSCSNCHVSHNTLGTTGYNNICLDCHKPGVPKGKAKPHVPSDAADPFGVYTAFLPGTRYQISHRWDGSDTVPAAGAQPPQHEAMTRLDLRGRTNGSMACVRCHSPHSNSARPFLRMGNDGDQMCLDCHRSRDRSTHVAGTHPVNVRYSSAKPKHATPVNANPANPTSALKLKNGRVQCTTCHGVHYTDSNSATYDGYSSYLSLKPADGFLLRTDRRGKTSGNVNICTNCHAGRFAHDGNGQNIQCIDCHGAHVEHDPFAAGAQERVPNVFLIRRFMNISTQFGKIDNRNSAGRTFFQMTGAGRNYKSADGSGVCQGCHPVPPAGFHAGKGKYYPPQHNDTTGNPQVCNECHTHDNEEGSFSGGGCALCHGYPPATAAIGGGAGLAQPSTGALGGVPAGPGAHPAHVNIRTMNCEACHSGFTATQMGDTRIEIGFAINSQTFPGFGGSVSAGTFTGTDSLTGYTWRASSPGTIIATAPGAATCSVYCHGTTLAGGSVPAPSWLGGASQAACGACHGATGASPPPGGSHVHHAGTGGGNLGLACAACHTNITDNAHVNGSVTWSLDSTDPRFGSSARYRGARTGATGNLAPSSSYGTCSVYCHGSATPAWGAANPKADCTWCHGNNASSTVPIVQGRHQAHVNNAAVLGKNYDCGTCHAATVASGNDRTISGVAHVDGVKDVDMLPSGTWNSGGENCTNVYCHSNGKGIFVNPPAWSSVTTLGCNGCHGTGNAFGTPDNSAPDSHAVHVASAADCARCHRTTTITGTAIVAGSAKHTNQTHDVNLAAISAFTTFSGVYDSATQKCSATYCHGSTQTSPAWGGNATCESCHDASNGGELSGATGGFPSGHALHFDSATAPTVITGGNAHTATAYVFGCRTCHPTASHASGPVSASRTAEINGTRLTPAQYTAGGGSLTDPRGFTYTNGTCLTLCHSRDGATEGSANAAATWNGLKTAGNCGVCHSKAGDAVPTWSAAHTIHINTYSTNPNLTCNACHAGTASDNGTINGAAGRNQHPDGVKNVLFNTFAGGSWSAGACSNTWCHSNATSASAPAHGSISWSSPPAITCASCHGGTASGPAYANGSPKANSHAVHVADYTCRTCHNTVVDGANSVIGRALHVNKAYDLAAGPGASFSVTAGTGTPSSPAECTNISCHGGNNATWGGTLGCEDCHGGPADVANFAATFWSDGTVGKIRLGGHWDTTGHGRPSGSYASGNPAAAFTADNACEYCHDPGVSHENGANPFRLKHYSTAAWGRNAPCLVCHSTDATGVTIDSTLRIHTAVASIDSQHFGAKHGGANGTGGRFCWDCHDPHGDGNIYMIHDQVARTSDPVTGAPVDTRATIFTSAETGTDFAKSSAPYNGICNVCHTATDHYTAAAGDGHNSGTMCVECHRHDNSDRTEGFTSIGSCDFCHGYPPVRRGLAVGTVFFQGNYSSARYEDYSGGGGAHTIEKHVKSTARASEGWENCAVCHSRGLHNPVTHTGNIPVKPSKITVTVDRQYKYDYKRQLGAARYTGKLLDNHDNETGTCSNIKCHFKPSKKWSNEK
ncbi:CxxxxCH/CxxCH domain-containing protein [Geobacter sp. DSM 9736]|uniref:CxxxxCH/CxxCH domain c-type cytochrome n=1 Tax=Geobacter sp. DSM 9736 TaxID=1277350 RepID=UPI000B4FF1B1|nr:CxxxxCH/CxxCH domain-containing protein [Geobacter sp. DSM 9736]SNB47392.1 Geobacter sulfurreducens CxxxxCH...CXXCH domain-containing protein [Geobacter sp. DSM 9736]